MRYPITPTVIASICFTAGVALSLFMRLPISIHAFVLVFVLFLSSFILAFRRDKAAYVVVCILLFFIGYAYTSFRYNDFYREDLTEEGASNGRYILGEVEHYEGLSLNKHSHIFKVKEIIDEEGNSTKAFGYTRLYSYLEEPFYTGEELIISSKLRPYSVSLRGEEQILKMLDSKWRFGTLYVYRLTEVFRVSEASPITKAAVSLSFSIRRKISSVFASLPPPHYALAKCMFLGDRGLIDDETSSYFAKAGTSHVLAVSGLHVGMLISIVLLLILPLPLRFQTRILIASCFVFFTYAPITLYRPSVVRASMAALLFSVLLFVDISRAPINILFIVLGAIFLVSPKSIMDVSLQFSFAATLSILLYMEPILGVFKRLPFYENRVFKYLSSAIVMSFSALLGTSFLSLYYFGTIAPVSLVANIFAVPLSWLFLASLCFMLIFAFVPFISQGLSLFVMLSADGLILTSKIFSSFPLNISFSPTAVITFVATLVILLLGFWALGVSLWKGKPCNVDS